MSRLLGMQSPLQQSGFQGIPVLQGREDVRA
jgi:hypothetical protein